MPLRDSFNGTSTCWHCTHSFANMYILKDYTKKYACELFNAAQGSVIPISARVEIRMHLRHQSFQGLLLDQGLCIELSKHCAFPTPRLLSKPWADTMQIHIPQHLDDQTRNDWGGQRILDQGQAFVHSAKFVPRECNYINARVTFQLAIMSGRIMQLDHYLVMPINKRPWSTAFPGTDHPEVHYPALDIDPATPPWRPKPIEIRPKPDQMTATALHRCPKRGRPSQTPGPNSLARILKIPCIGSIPARKITYDCPLRHEIVGRKALASYLRFCHDFDRPTEMNFVPTRDVMPGRLTCAHYRATFRMELVLRNHFKRSSCPVRLCNMVRDLHFGLRL